MKSCKMGVISGRKAKKQKMGEKYISKSGNCGGEGGGGKNKKKKKKKSPASQAARNERRLEAKKKS